METELKTAIWQIANAAHEMYEDKLNGKEFEELAINALRQVKNLNIPSVIKSVCGLHKEAADCKHRNNGKCDFSGNCYFQKDVL